MISDWRMGKKRKSRGLAFIAALGALSFALVSVTMKEDSISAAFAITVFIGYEKVLHNGHE